MKFHLKCPQCGYKEIRELEASIEAPVCPKCLCDMMAEKVTK